MSFRDESAGFLVNHMGRLFANALHARIRPLGLAPAQFMTLLELWEGDGLTQRDIARRLDVEQATMANTLARMERDGLIVRRASPSDARSQTVHLTRRALALREPAMEAAKAVNAAALAGLSDDDREKFLATMRGTIAALSAR
jgi:DNA-binding MarR family transcriptional regulator